jgi:hypothetical protein
MVDSARPYDYIRIDDAQLKESAMRLAQQVCLMISGIGFISLIAGLCLYGITGKQLPFYPAVPLACFLPEILLKGVQHIQASWALGTRP